MDNTGLIAKLSKFPAGTEVAILDGFNGGGSPRTINLGPVEHIVKRDSDCDDIETPIGGTIAVIGYGCY